MSRVEYTSRHNHKCQMFVNPKHDLLGEDVIMFAAVWYIIMYIVYSSYRVFCGFYDRAMVVDDFMLP